MWTLHTANPEHWVPIKTVASFKRMREFQPLGLEWVVKALQLSEELEVDAAGENVRRKTEVQPPQGTVRAEYLCGAWHARRIARPENRPLTHGSRRALGRRTPRCRSGSRTFSTSTARPTPCACGGLTARKSSRCVNLPVRLRGKGPNCSDVCRADRAPCLSNLPTTNRWRRSSTLTRSRHGKARSC